eukprot:SAG11_NODE_552_length_8583_cov_3.699081_5_plen_75_part_00
MAFAYSCLHSVGKNLLVPFIYRSLIVAISYHAQRLFYRYNLAGYSTDDIISYMYPIVLFFNTHCFSAAHASCIE